MSVITTEDIGEKLNFWPRHNEAIYRRLESKHSWLEEKNGAREKSDDPLENEMVLNIGPQHPATHGVLRCAVKLDGETIDKCVIDIGYLHRGLEKVAENKTYQEFMPYTDRMDYLSPYSNNVAWCLAVEKVAGIEVPERAQWIRMMMCELARISAHLLWMGVGLMDAGAVSVFLWCFKYREDLYSIFDEVCGQRLTVSHSRIGGIASEPSEQGLAMIRDFAEKFPDTIAGWKKLLNRNRIWIDRNVGIGTLTADEVIAMGMTGPNLRGSGVAYDIRRFEPYLKYDDVDFIIPMREEGDSLARYFVRLEEMEESIKIIKQCLDKLPSVRGAIRSDDAKQAYPSKDEVYYSMEGLIHDFMYTDTGVCPPNGVWSYHAIEAPKGELGFYLQSDGTGHPYRARMNTPSFTNLQALEPMMEGAMMGDMVILIGTIDPVLGESDK
ncbi:MAG: NADH-quinone oxidoreductase subunit D [Rhodothermales bacterium]|nr:NADH-quinone oxidoreductase subunit D [Rhodothermales bacterium]MBO6779109.1 NADH-quinone oxidoreductase subunit D [Rhodothermales bacterium]